MNFKTLAPLKVYLLIIAIVSQFSCSKDTDLITDYVLSETQNTLDLSELILDDTFIINSNRSITLDVLANDNFENTEDVIITETSEPENGSVVINLDNTLTYTPDTAAETNPNTIEDTFTYTTEVVSEEEIVSTGTGNVTVTSGNKAPITGDNVYHVTTTGKANNNGKSEATAWNIEHAFKTAKAGDVVYIKAGIYDSPILTTVRSGTAGNKISFIGYKSTPGDVISTGRPTYTKAMFDSDNTVMDGSDMPLFNNNRGADKYPEGEYGININQHDYLHFENIKFQYYEAGIRSPYGGSVSNISFKNIIINESGNWNPTNPGYDKPYSVSPPTGNLNGWGFYMQGISNSQFNDCAVYNAGAASYFIVLADNILLDGCEAYSTKTGNASDYMFDFVRMTNSIHRNYYAYREDLDTSKMHLSRAVMLQLYSHDNIIENGTHVNLRTQVSTYSYDNILRNITVQGSGQANQGNLQISGESNDNIFYNWTIDGTEGIQFVGESDNRAPPNNPAYAGNNNYFINFKITNVPSGTGNAIFSYHRLSFSQKDSGGTNYVINLTADKSGALVNTNREGTLYIYNSTFSNITNYDTYSTSSGAGDALVQLNFDHCNFYDNGFSTPTNNSERTLTSTTSYNPLFNSDYSLPSNSPLKGIGMDASTISTNSTVDNAVSNDIGAFKY